MQGLPEVEQYMRPVATAISRHIDRKKDHAAWTDIYNRAYEAVMQAVQNAPIHSRSKLEG